MAYIPGQGSNPTVMFSSPSMQSTYSHLRFSAKKQNTWPMNLDGPEVPQPTQRLTAAFFVSKLVNRMQTIADRTKMSTADSTAVNQLLHLLDCIQDTFQAVSKRMPKLVFGEGGGFLRLGSAKLVNEIASIQGYYQEVYARPVHCAPFCRYVPNT